MPMYEYFCGKCEIDFETFVPSLTAVAEVACPICRSKKVHKKLSQFGVGAKSVSVAGSLPSTGYSGGGSCGGGCSCH